MLHQLHHLLQKTISFKYKIELSGRNVKKVFFSLERLVCQQVFHDLVGSRLCKNKLLNFCISFFVRLKENSEHMVCFMFYYRVHC